MIQILYSLLNILVLKIGSRKSYRQPPDYYLPLSLSLCSMIASIASQIFQNISTIRILGSFLSYFRITNWLIDLQSIQMRTQSYTHLRRIRTFHIGKSLHLGRSYMHIQQYLFIQGYTQKTLLQTISIRTSHMGQYIIFGIILKQINGSKLIAISTALSQDAKRIRAFRVLLKELRSLVRNFTLL